MKYRLFVFLLSLLTLSGCERRVVSPDEGFIDVPGGRVWYRVVGKGPGTPLLLLHGGPGAPSYYLKPLAALGDERPVIFYDQLGCGRSDRPTDSTLWTIQRFIEELADLLQELAANEDQLRNLIAQVDAQATRILRSTSGRTH